MQQYSTWEFPDTSPNTASSTAPTVTPRAWLEQWPPARRSFISNLFHDAVRDGATTSALVVHAVHTVLHQRLRYATLPRNTTDATLRAVLQSLQTAPDDAYAYAQTVLDWEALPYDERQQRKAERGRHFQQQYMAVQPVTDKQLRYLQSLGYPGDAPASCADASALIDSILTARREGQP